MLCLAAVGTGTLLGINHSIKTVGRGRILSQEQAAALGVDTILTSGQCATAQEGAALLAQLVRQAEGHVMIMPGSGVNAGNIARLYAQTGARAFHLSAKRTVSSGMAFRRAGVPMGLPMMSEFERFVTDAQAVAAAKRALETRI